MERLNRHNRQQHHLRRGTVERQLVRLSVDGVAVRLGHVRQGVPDQSSGFTTDNLVQIQQNWFQLVVCKKSIDLHIKSTDHEK